MVAIGHQFLFSNAVASATAAFQYAGGIDAHVLHPVIAITPGTDFSGSIRFQGRMSALHDWNDVWLVKLSEHDDNPVPSIGTLALSPLAGQEGSTTYYRVVDYYPQMQAVLSVGAGTLTSVEWWAHENDNYAPRHVRAVLEGSQLASMESLASLPAKLDAHTRLLTQIRNALAELVFEAPGSSVPTDD